MMKCILLAASALALASCGGSDTTTPNTPINIDENAPAVDNGSVPAVDNGAVAKGENKADALRAGNGHVVTAAAPADAKHPDVAPAAPAHAAKPQDAKAKHADVENRADDHGPKPKQ